MEKEKLILLLKVILDDYYKKYRDLSLPTFDSYIRHEAEKILSIKGEE